MSEPPAITGSVPEPGDWQAERVAFLEGVIAAGIKTFVEVGNALLEIREHRLYALTHATFEEYCRDRWDMSRKHAFRMIQAVEIVASIGKTPPRPTAESQVRPLARLPKARRAEAWEAAAKSARNGKPTARQVEAVVDAIAPKPEPDDIKAQREAGIIPEVAVVTVDEPEEACVEAAGEEPDAELSDGDWLATCPARDKLAGPAASRFDADALLYRELAPLRIAFAARCKPVTNRAKRAARGHIGAFMDKHFWYLRIKHPRQWAPCYECRNPDGLSTGQTPVIGKCPECRGHGYTV